MFLAQALSELSGRDACGLVELPAEMFDVFVAALFRDLGDALFRVGEEIFCLAESEIDDIIRRILSFILIIHRLLSNCNRTGNGMQSYHSQR